MTEAELAWAAGLFEGEGCITISHGRKASGAVYMQPRLKVSMVDQDIVERFHAIVGVGQTCVQKFRDPSFKDQLCWYTGARADVAAVLTQFLPWLGARRRARA